MEILFYLLPIASLVLCISLKSESYDEIQARKMRLYDWEFEYVLNYYNNLPQHRKRNYVDFTVKFKTNDIATRLKEVYYKELNLIANNRIKNLK